MKITLRSSGPASPDLAWERYMDTSLWSVWAPQIRHVQASTPRLLTGTTGVVDAPLGVRVRFEVLAVDQARRTWAWRAWIARRSIGMTLDHGVLARPGGGCRTWLTIDALAPVVLAYAPVAQIALRSLVTVEE